MSNKPQVQMAKLVLHVGAHKTGTTFLQSTFHHNRKLLAEHGIHYPDLGPNKAHHMLAAPWKDAEEVQRGVDKLGGPQKVWDQFLSEYAKKEGTVFLSSEVFSSANAQTIDMADLAGRLSVFEDVQVLYTLREQAELAQSVWLQVSKSHALGSVNRLFDDTMEKRRWRGVWLDHNLLYDHLLTGFRPDQIQFLDYDQIKVQQGGIVGAFLEKLDSQLDASALEPAKTEEANVSPDALSFLIAGQINEGNTPPADLVTAVSNIIRPDPSIRTTLWRRSQYRRIIRRYRAPNKRLLERIRPFQPDFTYAEAVPPADHIYREDIAEVHWLELIKMFRSPSRKAQDTSKLTSVLGRLPGLSKSK